MLVLRRHKGERLEINEYIELAVFEFSRSPVLSGIECPREVPICRRDIIKVDVPGTSIFVANGSVPRQNREKLQTKN